MIRHTHHHQRGIVVISALLFSITILALAASVITSAVSLNNQKRYAVASDRAMEAAESGIHHLLAALAGPNGADLKAAGELTANLQGDSDRAIRYELSFSTGKDDGHDNDMDGQFDESDEAKVYEVVSTGIADNVQYAIAVTVRKSVLKADIPGGLVWDNPNMQIETINPDNGAGTFLISGNDVDLDGNPTGLKVPGVAISGSTNSFKSGVDEGDFSDNIVGEGGNWSIQDTPNTFDYQEWIDMARTEADVVLDKEGGVISGGSGPYGSVDNPVLVWAKGDDPGADGNHISFKNTTGITGFGILVIDGSLEVQSDEIEFNWTGIVIVRGYMLVDSSWDMPLTIRGALVMHGPGDNPSKVTEDVTFTVEYSSEAIYMAEERVMPSNWEVFHWREAPIAKDGAKP